MYGLSVVSAPATEPVTLAEAKAHLRVEHTADDAYITTLIEAVRTCIEGITHRALVTQTLELTLDAFPSCSGVVRLPRNPVSAVTSVQYIDDAGITQTLDAAKYRVDLKSIVARLTPAYGEIWPTTRPITNAVIVTFTAGYGTAGAVPKAIKQAILLSIGTYYDTLRETVIVGDSVQEVPPAAGFLLGPYRVATHAGAA